MIRILLFIALTITTGCDKEAILTFQNCYGERAEITIILEENEIEILPEVKEFTIGNQINFPLEYPGEKDIMKISLKKIKEGSSINRIIVTREKKGKDIYYGDAIIWLMDTDVMGEIGCCPFSMCL